MKKSFPNHFAILAGGLLLAFALVLTLSNGAAFASAPLLQATVTPTTGDYPGPGTSTPTVTATTQGAATITVTATVTATQSGTLAPPARTGTPTMLVPVTGVDLDQPGGPSIGIWLAIWLIGLLLVFYGLRAKTEKR